MAEKPYPGNDGYIGARDDESDTSGFNAHAFLIKQMIGQISTATLVQVKAVTNAGALAAVGFVDVHPLVNQIDGLGNSVPHGVIYHVPYFRIQGGGNAIILDPQVGDIGIAIFAGQDISSVKASKARSNPGSRRRFNMADALYIGGVLNGVPTQFVRFSASGIELVSPTEIDISAPVVRVHAATSLHVDCDGNGFVYTPSNRDDYSIGSTGSTKPLNPPEVP